MTRAYRALPLALLLLALATVFLFRGDRGHFYHAGVHDELTWNTMTVALNLSPEHDFLGFFRLILDDDGNRTYEPYNRFPVLGQALIKLVTLPFHDDLSARLSAARTLMLAFFAAAATLAYLALCRLVRNRRAALAATLLAFSSLYAMYYNDAVATEGAVGLFGVMLVFHGMAVFATEGRFGQLLAKTCMALLPDWMYYFTGSVFAGKHLADFVVSERIESARTLTPGNRLVFLYDRASYGDGWQTGVPYTPGRDRLIHGRPARPSTAGAPMVRPVPRPPACPAQGRRSEGRHSSATFSHI